MNYNSLLDAFFGNAWISYGVPFLIYILCIIIITTVKGKKKKNSNTTKNKKSKKSRILTVLLYVVPLLIIFGNGEINPIFFGYGSARGITEIRYVDGKLYVMDYILTAGGKSSSGQKYYRINILDPSTGKKILRFQACAGAKLLGINGDRIAISHFSDVTYYSAANGSILATYSKKTLPKLFPEFSSGVENFSWDADGCKINVTTLNGSAWVLDATTGKVQTSEDIAAEANQNKRAPYVPSNKLYIDGNDIEIDDYAEGSGHDYITLEGKGSNSHQLHLYDSQGSILLENLFFLDGEPVAIDTKDSCFVILHYETTKNEKFILTGIALDGSKKLWEFRQSSINPDYKIKSYKYFKIDTDPENGIMFMNIRTEIVAINMKDGKLLWRQKL